MKVLLFGATGMVGQGVLRECLLAQDVEEVLAIGRTATGQRHSRLRELIRSDLFDYAPVADQLKGFDACFFCLGVSSARMTEAAYTRLTYDLTLAAATILARLNPGMTFIYVSGAGTDSTEKGRSMWARVKGRTENAILRMPFKAAYMLRPAVILPAHGERSKTPLYRSLYTILGPLIHLVRPLAKTRILTTEIVAKAMLELVRHDGSKLTLDPPDIYRKGTAIRPS